MMTVVDKELLSRVFDVCSRIQNELTNFVCTDSFRSLLGEMSSLPEHLRHEFVELVLLDKAQLARRGVHVPKGIEIQRSFFADQRPTLFCVSKAVPAGHLWKKITITFDNERVGLANPQFACSEDGQLLPILRGH
jgi:hypothetical protein